MGFALAPLPADTPAVCIHRVVAGLLAAVLFERAGQARPLPLHEEAARLDHLADTADAAGLAINARVYRDAAELIRRAVAEGTIVFGQSLIGKALDGMEVARG